jgi:hypothetical protein
MGTILIFTGKNWDRWDARQFCALRRWGTFVPGSLVCPQFSLSVLRLRSRHRFSQRTRETVHPAWPAPIDKIQIAVVALRPLKTGGGKRMGLKWTTLSIVLMIACQGSTLSAEAQNQGLPPGFGGRKVSAVVADITVNHGDYIAGGDGYGYCPSTHAYENERNLTRLAGAAIVAKLSLGTWGVLGWNFVSQLFDQQIRQSGGTIKEWLEGFGAVDSFAACGNVTLAVPEGKEIQSVSVSATDAQNNGELLPCPPDGNGRLVCRIGWSEWVWSQNGRVFTGIFKNWSGDRTRHARMVVWYYVE